MIWRDVSSLFWVAKGAIIGLMLILLSEILEAFTYRVVFAETYLDVTEIAMESDS